nr:type IV secretion system protein [Sphingomonas sp. CARO-RG-8B-R24-01]
MTAAGVLYFVLLGIMVIRGIVASPLAELGMSALKFGLVIALIGSTGFTSTVITTANGLPGALISAGGGTPISNPGEAMDKYFGNAQKLVAIVQNKWAKDEADMTGASSAASVVGSVLGQNAANTTAAIMSPGQSITLMADKLVESLALVVVLLIAGLSACIGFVIYVFALFALDVVLALTPIAIACTLFAQTRWVFQGWLSQLLNYVFLMVIVAIVSAMVIGLNTAVMSDVTGVSVTTGAAGQVLNASSGGATVALASTAEVIMACISVAVIYILGTLFFFQAPAISSGIFGGSASGGHNFMAVGVSQIMNRMNRGRMPSGSSGAGGGGGSIRKGN